MLTALQANFKHVNPDWIVGYANHGMNAEEPPTTLLGLEDVEGITVEAIQAAIYEVNGDKIDAANLEGEEGNETFIAKTAAGQAKVTALIEAWMEPDDPENELSTDKEQAIYNSKKAEAQFRIIDAKTTNMLYNALVAYAEFIADEANPNYEVKDVKSENKAKYWEVVDAVEDGVSARAGFVTNIQEGNIDIKTSIIAAGDEAAGDALLAAVKNATTADKLLAALKAYPGLENVVDANKDFYWAETPAEGTTEATINDNFSSVTADGIQKTVDDINHDVTVADQVKAINEAETVAEVKALLW